MEPRPVPPDRIARLRRQSIRAVQLHNLLIPDEPYNPPVQVDMRSPFTVLPRLR